MTFSFRGLDIRHRLPDRKGVGNLVRREAHVGLKGFPHPRTVRTHPASMISERDTKSKQEGVRGVRYGLLSIEETYLAIGQRCFIHQAHVHLIRR